MSGSLALPIGSVPAFVDRRRVLRGGAVIAVAALFLLAVQGWSPALGDRSASTPAANPSRVPASMADPTLDAGSIERATHGLRPVAGAPGTLEARDAAYVTRFDASGFAYAPTSAPRALGISLASLARGGSAVPLDLGAWTGTENVAQRPAAPGVSEQVTARTGEVEWDVVLDSAPTGQGDLAIGATLDGVTGEPTRVGIDGGQAWRLGLSDGSSVKLGEMVVRDATGADLYRALPRVDGDRIEMVVPDAVLRGAAYPMVVDPAVSDATLVRHGDGNIVGPDVAFDGTNYLVVWQETRDTGSRFVHDILGARVDGAGAVIDDRVFPITPRSPDVDQTAPSVAWNGNSFLVVNKSTCTCSPDTLISSQRVSSTGALLDADTVSSSSNSNNLYAPAVAAAGQSTGGTRWFVVWQDARNGPTDIYGSRVNSSGKVLDPAGKRITPTSDYESQPDIAWNGTNFFVVWTLNFFDTDIVGRLIGPDGSLRTFGPTNISGSTVADARGTPAVASDGSGFLVAWQRQAANNGPVDVYAGRVDGSGQALNGDGFAISTAPGAQSDPAVAYNGTYIAVWKDEQFGDPDIYAALIPSSGNPQAPFEVAAGPSNEAAPAVARGAGNQTWVTDYTVGGLDIQHRRITPK